MPGGEKFKAGRAETPPPAVTNLGWLALNNLVQMVKVFDGAGLNREARSRSGTTESLSG